MNENNHFLVALSLASCCLIDAFTDSFEFLDTSLTKDSQISSHDLSEQCTLQSSLMLDRICSFTVLIVSILMSSVKVSSALSAILLNTWQVARLLEATGLAGTSRSTFLKCSTAPLNCQSKIQQNPSLRYINTFKLVSYLAFYFTGAASLSYIVQFLYSLLTQLKKFMASSLRPVSKHVRPAFDST